MTELEKLAVEFIASRDRYMRAREDDSYTEQEKHEECVTLFNAEQDLTKCVCTQYQEDYNKLYNMSVETE